MARGMRSSPNIHSVESCLVLSGNYCCCCMCCCWNTLHEVYTSQIVNNNVHKSSKTIFDNDNIHWSLCMTRKKWKTSLYMWAPFYNGIIPTIFETYPELTLPQTTYQMDTQIIDGMTAVTWWKMCNRRMWDTKANTTSCTCPSFTNDHQKNFVNYK
jgi:hypothetical protein